MSFSLREYSEKTGVSSIGAKILSEMEYWLPLVANLTQRTVVFFVQSEDMRNIIITAKAIPDVGNKIGFGSIGDKFPLRHEYIISNVLKTGEPVFGTREIDLETTVLFDVYPLYDNAGLTFAAVGFVGLEETVPELLINCAWRLLSMPQPVNEKADLSVSPHDGILLFSGATGRIIYANEVGQRLAKILDAESMKSAFRLDESTGVYPVMKARRDKTIVAEEWECAGAIMYGRAFPITESGKVATILLLLTDVTVLREKERELFVKDVVIQEIHHRVKNNLQTVAGLLRMQARRSDEQTKHALRQADRRIRAIAAIHDILAKQADEKVRLSLLIEELTMQIGHEWSPEVTIVTDIQETAYISSEHAVSIGMVIHELIQNACEHGHKSGKTKNVTLSLRRNEQVIQIIVTNDGKPLPADFSEKSYNLGLQIVENLICRNLGGKFKIYNNNHMVIAECVFPDWSK